MRQSQPPDLRVEYLGKRAYEMGFWKWSKWDYIVHLANVSPAEVIAFSKGARLLYCSSGIVYHAENDTEYRQNKIRWERECLQSGVDCVIARLFTFSGDGLGKDKAWTQFVRAARMGKPLHVHGDGSCVRSYMSSEELGKWMWTVLFKGASGEAYDIGSDQPITMLELARQFSNYVIMEPDKNSPMPIYLPPNTAKTRALL